MRKAIIFFLLCVSFAGAWNRAWDRRGGGGTANYDSINVLIGDSLAAKDSVGKADTANVAKGLSIVPDSSAKAETSLVAKGLSFTPDSCAKSESTVYYVNIATDTAVVWDSITGADDSVASVVGDSLDNYLPLADVDDSVSNIVDDSLDNYAHLSELDDSIKAGFTNYLVDSVINKAVASDTCDTAAFARIAASADTCDTAAYARVSGSGGGGSGFAVDLEAGDFDYIVTATTGPFLERSNGTNQSMLYHPFDATSNETLVFRYTVPLDKSGTDYLKSTLKGFAKTAAANDTAMYALMMCFRADGESWDNAVTFRDTLSPMAISATQNEIITVYDSTTLTNAGAVAGDECMGWLVRIPGVTKDDHAGDFCIFRLKIE